MLPSTNPRVVYIGNNTTGTYPWTWIVYLATDLHVAVLDTSGNLTNLVLGTDYTIQNPNLQLDNSEGGYIVLTSAGFFAPSNGILPTGWALTIRRAVTFQQSTELTSQGLYDPASVEGALDFLAMQTIQLLDKFNYVPVLPLDDVSAPVQGIDVASVRANQFMAFDGAGNLINTPGNLIGTIPSTLGSLIVQAASAAQAVNALGIGSLIPLVNPSNTYTLGTGYYNFSISAPLENPIGLIVFVPSATNTRSGEAYFNISGSSPLPVYTKAGAATSGGELVAGSVYLLALVGSYWQIIA